VTKLELQKSSKLVRASARLDAAVERIEGALLVQNASSSEKIIDPELAKKLDSELVILRSENSLLKIVNKTLSGRLDESIRRLQDFIREV
jgi:hypothetical protein